MAAWIDRIYAQCCEGGFADRATLLRMLALNPLSEEARVLRAAAHRAAQHLAAGRAYLWSALGVDNTPCPMNCRFCSFGAAWGLVTTEKIYSYTALRQWFVGGGIPCTTRGTRKLIRHKTATS